MDYAVSGNAQFDQYHQTAVSGNVQFDQYHQIAHLVPPANELGYQSEEQTLF